MPDQFYTDERGDNRTGDVVHSEVAVEAAVAMAGTPELTFARVAGANDTIIRDAGSWAADGFNADWVVAFTGTVSNNRSFEIAAISTTTNPNDTLEIAGDLVVDEVVAAAGAQVAVGSIALALANPNRRWMILQNIGPGGDIFIRFDETPSIVDEGLRLSIGESFRWPRNANNALYRGPVTGVSAAASETVLVSEA